MLKCIKLFSLNMKFIVGQLHLIKTVKGIHVQVQTFSPPICYYWRESREMIGTSRNASWPASKCLPFSFKVDWGRDRSPASREIQFLS